jgi:hypothetical protein
MTLGLSQPRVSFNILSIARWTRTRVDELSTAVLLATGEPVNIPSPNLFASTVLIRKSAPAQLLFNQMHAKKGIWVTSYNVKLTPN